MDYNEWLLEDRLHVIDITIIKDKHNFKFVLSNNLQRDLVMLKLFETVAGWYGKDHVLNENEDEIVVRSIVNVDCVKYKDNKLIEFNPLRVCDDDWIEWYVNNFIKRSTNGKKKEV